MARVKELGGDLVHASQAPADLAGHLLACVVAPHLQSPGDPLELFLLESAEDRVPRQPTNLLVHATSVGSPKRRIHPMGGERAGDGV